MTIKPKAKKFRIRRAVPLVSPTARSSAPAAAAAPLRMAGLGGGGATAAARKAEYDDDDLFDTGEDGFGPEPFPTARNANVAPPQQVAGEADIDAIRREGLTGRQLRM